MTLRIVQISTVILLFLSISCRSPQRADLKAYLPAETLIYLETDDLSKIGGVFTENKDWRSLSGGAPKDLSFLRNKQAALGVTGFVNSGEGAVLQVKPDLVLLIDTQAGQSAAALTAERVLRELHGRFSGENGVVEKYADGETQWLAAAGSQGKKIFAAVPGSVILIGNSEAALKRCLETKQAGGGDLSGNRELLEAREQRAAPDGIAFGYISPAGVRELSNYLAVSWALESSENALTREMISGILPEILQRTVSSAAWSARLTETGVEDTYFVKTEKEFAGTVSRTVKASAASACESKYLPGDVYSASCYRLEDPQLAWRGAVLSLAKQLDPKVLGLFEQFSRQLLGPYGIDDPELFLSAAGSEIITARFDADADEAAVIVKIKDKDKLKRAVSETFDFRKAPEAAPETGPRTGPEIADAAEIWKSRDGEFTAAFSNDELVIGTSLGVAKCLEAARPGTRETLAMPENFHGAGAVVSTRQKDDAAFQILSHVASQNNKTAEAGGYYYTETRIETWGIKRRTVSAFGLFGEMLRQTMR